MLPRFIDAKPFCAQSADANFTCIRSLEIFLAEIVVTTLGRFEVAVHVLVIFSLFATDEKVNAGSAFD